MVHAGNVSFADFVAGLSRPVSLTLSDTWSCQEPAPLPGVVQKLLERRARAHELAQAPMLFRRSRPSTLLLRGAAPGEQRSAAMWLAERLALRLFLFDACDLNEADPSSLSGALAPLTENAACLVVIRNIDVLESAEALALVSRRARNVFLLATAGVNVTPRSHSRSRVSFAATFDWPTFP